MDLDKLKFDERGLIPAIVVDAENKKVLTLAYMNRESLEISMREGRTCFWSRSRRELWRKGETSGNVQRIVSITADCDMDALTVLVEKDNFGLTFGANISLNQNKVLSLGKLPRIESQSRWASSEVGVDYVVEQGQPLGNMYGYFSDGYYTTADFASTGRRAAGDRAAATEI